MVGMLEGFSQIVHMCSHIIQAIRYDYFDVLLVNGADDGKRGIS